MLYFYRGRNLKLKVMMKPIVSKTVFGTDKLFITNVLLNDQIPEQNSQLVKIN